MLYRIAADVVVVVHLAFVVFVPFGALLALKWRWIPWLHLPAAAWGLFIEATGRACPLTDLENALRSRTGEPGYSGGFIEHYLVAPISAGGLTAEVQFILLAAVIATNALTYGWLHVRWFRSRRRAP
ncbi:MAG TPA: DUF2784 domain-containing protein [Burkholderiaceae bacterium]|nr:DUF2784 domain-containing protein [Burkholderiaceae bacterium]